MKKYILRRELLTAARDRRPGLIDVDAACRMPLIQMADLQRDLIAAALQDLAAFGYLENVRPGRRPLYRITVKGLAQIDQETDLDEYVWGEHASKFH